MFAPTRRFPNRGGYDCLRVVAADRRDDRAASPACFHSSLLMSVERTIFSSLHPGIDQSSSLIGDDNLLRSHGLSVTRLMHHKGMGMSMVCRLFVRVS